MQDPYTRVSAVDDRCAQRYQTALLPALREKESTNLTAAKKWKKYTTEDGRDYYFNKETQETQWLPPEEVNSCNLNLEEVQGVDLAEYQRSLLERFSNTYIKDKLSRLAQDGSQKFMNTLKDALLAYREKMAFTREITAKAANWILPRDRHAGEGTSMVALALAAFMRYCNSTDLDGELLPLDDPLSDLLREHAARATLVSDGQPAMVGRAERLDATRMFLAAIFGDEVSSWGAFVDTVFSHAERLQRKSCRDVLRQCRLDQLRIIRNDMRETESKLKELRRAEALLTTESERDDVVDRRSLRVPLPGVFVDSVATDLATLRITLHESGN